MSDTPIHAQAALPPIRWRGWVIAGLGVIALSSIVISCLAGSVGLSLPELWAGVVSWTDAGDDGLAGQLLSLRLWRALNAFCTGAMLALAGVMMQALLRNPLADPYVLGVSGGASVGALAAMLAVGLGWAVDGAAFGGALLTAMLLFALANRDLRSGADAGSTTLLLTGVVVASGCGALVTLLLSIAPDARLRGMVFWLVGDFSGAEARLSPWLLLACVLFFAMRGARAVNLLAMHADHAAVLGVSVGKVRRLLFFAAALLTASSVATAGSIGFVGLIVPHACRFAWGADHRLLLPTSALAGGSFLVLADTLARTVLAPHQLPVGAVTALLGVPAFLWQLHRIRRR